MDMNGTGEFSGQVVLVTGAASGIGRAAAIAFAREGARLALVDRDLDGLAETQRIVGSDETWLGELDVLDAAAVEATISAAVAHFGRLDCAVNAAGVSTARKVGLADYSVDEFDRIMNVNTRGLWLCMKYEIAAMLQTGGGAIVNIASGAGVIAVPDNGAYVASKHAVVGLTRAGAADYAAKNIRINAVCPGFTRTPMAERALVAMQIDEKLAGAAAPIGRMAEAEEQASAILFLCSTRASFMAGHAMLVDGGHSIV